MVDTACNIDNEELNSIDIRKLCSKKKMHAGGKGLISAELRAALLTFFQDRRKDGMVVTVPMPTIELI